MKSEEMINQICVERHMTKLSISTIPTWMDKNRHEGIELRAGEIIPFCVEGCERVYNEPAGTEILKTMELLKGEEINEKSKKEDRKDEQTKKQTDNSSAKTEIPISDSKDVALLSEFLTPALMSKWAKMSTIDRMLIFQRTPKGQIFERKAGKDENGNVVMVSYVKGNYMIKEANAAFLFNWRFIHIGISVSEIAVCVYGTLEAEIDGKMYSRPATGYEEINKKMTAQLAIKSATTDAIKKGLSLFGFNSDVYSGEV